MQLLSFIDRFTIMIGAGSYNCTTRLLLLMTNQHPQYIMRYITVPALQMQLACSTLLPRYGNPTTLLSIVSPSIVLVLPPFPRHSPTVFRLAEQFDLAGRISEDTCLSRNGVNRLFRLRQPRRERRVRPENGALCPNEINAARLMTFPARRGGTRLNGLFRFCRYDDARFE